MSRAFFLLASLLLALAPAWGQQTRDSAADSFGEGPAAERVLSRLSRLGGTVSKRPLAAATGGFGVSVLVDFGAKPGASASGLSSLIVAAPLSSSVRDRNAPLDYGVRTALALAEALSREGAPLPVRVAFLADEKSELPADLRGRTALGLRDLVESIPDAESAALVYLDLPGEAPGLELAHGAAGGVAPRYLIEALAGAFSERSRRLPFSVRYNELYRLGLVEGPGELRLLRERGVAAVLLGTPRLPDRNAAAGPAPEETAGILLSAIGRLSATDAERDERYALIPFGAVSALLPEGPTVAAFMLTAAVFLTAFLSYSLTHRHLLVARWNMFLLRSWLILAFLAVFFLCLLASGLLLSLLLGLAGAAAETNPAGAAAVKLLLSLSLFYAVSAVFSFRIFPRRSHFYGSAAVICLAFGALVSAVLDFTFLPVFIWAFAFAFVSVAIKSPAFAVLPSLLAPLQIAGAAAAGLGSGESGTALAVLAGGPAVELYLSFIILPFLFLAIRLSLLFRSAALRREGRIAPIRGYRRFTRPILFVGVVCAAAAFALDAAARARGTSAPSRAERTDEAEFSLSASDALFLDRRTVNLRLAAEGRPVRFELKVSSDERIAVYDAPVPFLLSADGASATAELGERPPNPFALEITLPAALSARIEARALFYDAASDGAVFLGARTSVGPKSAR